MTCPVCGQEPRSRWYCQQCGAPQPALTQANSGQTAERSGRWKRWLLWGVISGFTACVGLIILAALSFDPAALALAVAASAIPAMLYSYLVLRLDRYEREPW